MIAICVDDEPILLEWLNKVVSASPDIACSEKFLNEAEALRFAEQNYFDVAFLDIELHEMNGVALAEQLRKRNPDCGIIFCTGHATYAVDAIERLRVDGYLLKPIKAADVQREIDRFKSRFQKGSALLTVDLSNGVNIFDKAGRPVCFRRRKTEELFAVLVQQNGQSLSVRELCAILWENSGGDTYLLEKNGNYLAQLFTDLRRSLEKCGAQDVLKKTDDGYTVRMPLIAVRGQK